MKNSSSVLVIFDGNVNVNLLDKELSALHPQNIYLFPLSSNWQLIYEIESVTKNLLGTNIEIELIKSAELIDKEVDILREKVSKWSADLGDSVVGGKSVKEWFLLPGKEVSTWWFSLLSEKNTLKTDVFFRLAQLQALDKIISSHSFGLCICSISEQSFSSSVEMLCKRHSIDMLHIISSLERGKTFRGEIKSYLNRKNSFCFILNALIHLAIHILRAIRAKLVMGSIENRIEISNKSILFVSYFPAVDKEAAKKGILKNKYAIPLQEKFFHKGKSIIWIWMYTFLDGHSYGDALLIAKKFTKSGEANFFLDEFMSFKILFRVLFLWFHQIRVFFALRKLIPERVLYKDLSIPEAVVLIKSLMAESFVGRIGLESILYFELYKKVFSYFPNVPHCIYYMEMHAWEKALNAAAKLKSRKTKTIGFQHTSISKNYFHYFHHSNEIEKTQKSIDLPLPDILACNGGIPYQMMAESNYPNLKKVEAIRQLYLNDTLSNTNYIEKTIPVLLIIGSIDRDETIALISLVNSAFSKKQSFRVWLKGHPSMPMEGILKLLNIDREECEYEIKHDTIDKLLRDATGVIVGTSTVAIEALAFGCRVILPIFNDRMFMNPLKGFEKYYIGISNPAELETAIREIMRKNISKELYFRNVEFVKKYWCLDTSLKRWENILNKN